MFTHLGTMAQQNHIREARFGTFHLMCSSHNEEDSVLGKATIKMFNEEWRTDVNKRKVSKTISSKNGN